VYVFDTNAFIYYIEEEPPVVTVMEDLFSQEVPLYVSAITELELFSYPALTEEDEAKIERLLQGVRIIPLISRIARMAGDLRRLYRRLRTADSAIAATAIFTHSTLVTRNVRDFRKVEGLPLLEI
jgi:predicted nucleic acid-binding protein